MKTFTTAESETLEQIILHRRDVRGNRFLPDPLPEEVLQKILQAALHAPSVGFSQPWEFVLVKDPATRARVHGLFEQANKAGREAFAEGRKDQYGQLKLEGILEAPLNLAVFYKPSQGPVLGQTAMPEMGMYSVVCAIQNMWLMARALNVGMGWVSILDPEKVKTLLGVPPENRLVGYMCLGYVDLFYDKPELETKGWDMPKLIDEVVHYERYGKRAGR